MTRREGKGPPPSDLLVCFPTRARLALMPKPTCSPRRQLHHHHHNHLRKSMRGGSIGGGHASPYLKQMGSDNLSEPTSPKVTCAGQIKVRPSTRSCKNWQTVMEEIERLHNNRKKKSTWVEALGFKKEVMHFLSCLRRLNFDFNCLGSFSHVDITSDDEDEDEDKTNKEISQDQYLHDYGHDNKEDVSSQTVFSKWFMVLQENQDCGVFEKDEKSIKLNVTEDAPCLPPSNALLLMRCRSAPAKSWMEEKEEEEQEQENDDDDDDDDDDDHDDHDDDDDHHHDHHAHDHNKEEEDANNKDDKLVKKEGKRKSLMELMQNESDFYKLSCHDIAKETWIIGGIHKDPFSRSRSWKR